MMLHIITKQQTDIKRTLDGEEFTKIIALLLHFSHKIQLMIMPITLRKFHL